MTAIRKLSARPAPSMELVLVTPAMAEEWLGKNRKNRPLKPLNIERFARDMAMGRWRMTAEAVKFDWNGDLVDGQNRLHAVNRSGRDVWMFVARGLDPEAQSVMDSGAPRSAGDALSLIDIRDGKSVAAAANTYLAYTNGFFKHCMQHATPKLTTSEITAGVAQTPALIEAAYFARRLTTDFRLPTGALATAYLVFSGLDADDAVEFFARIAELRTDGKGDPVNTLLKRVKESSDRRERIWPATALYFLFRAWNACREDEHLEKFQLGSSIRGWASIPDPK